MCGTHYIYSYDAQVLHNITNYFKVQRLWTANFFLQTLGSICGFFLGVRPTAEQLLLLFCF